MEPFELHPRLAADCHRLGALVHCELLLHKNASVPWFILVPRGDQRELLELDPARRNAIVDECAVVAAFVKRELGAARVNFGAIGNLVPQLHLHVIGRHPDDPCWPLPVWGHLETVVAYPHAELRRLRARLAESIGLVASVL